MAIKGIPPRLIVSIVAGASLGLGSLTLLSGAGFSLPALISPNVQSIDLEALAD